MRVHILICLFTLLGVGSLTAQAYRLQFKDTQNAVNTYAMTVKMTGQLSVMGITVPVTSTTEAKTSEKVLKVANGLATIQFDMKEGKTHMDVSALPGEDQGQTIEQPVPTLTMTYDRTPLGVVSNMKMTGDFTTLFGANSDPTGGQMGVPGEGLVFPNKDLNTGDNWTGKQTISMFGNTPISLEANNTFAGISKVNGKTYLLIVSEITGKMPTTTLNPAATGQNADMKMSFGISAMKGHSTTLFDEAAGKIYQTKYSMDVTINMGILGQEGAGTLQMNMEGVTTLTK